MAHDSGQQLNAGTHPRTGKGAQVVLWLSRPDGLEVHHQPELIVVPHLVVIMQIAVHEHGLAGRGQRGVGPVALAHDGLVLIRPDPPADPVAQDLRGGWW